MLKNPKVTKENMIDACLEIVRCDGIKGVNVRKIADKLNCSVQPIYYQFGSMEELKKIVTDRIIQIYKEYMEKNLDKESPYKQIGINYIRFAKEEPKLFQLLFMTKTNLSSKNFMTSDESFENIKKYAKESTGLDDKEVTNYHVRMWIFTHGIACLVAMGTCIFSDEEISVMLTDEFKALNLLEKVNK